MTDHIQNNELAKSVALEEGQEAVDVDAPDKTHSTSEVNQRLYQLQWTPEEERHILRRLDFYLIPLTMIMFFTLNLDRGNLSNALTDNLMGDLNINQQTVNTGQMLVYVGIITGDIPGNIIIQRVGADRWLPCQLIAWGLVATFQAFSRNRSGFLATRYLLGFCESGFIPGALWYLTRWYTKRELGRRTVFFFVGSYTANLLNGLIAYGILRLRGRANLAGWQWLFIIDGLFTLSIGIATLFLLPRDPTRGNTLVKMPLTEFTPRESDILQARLARDNPYAVDPRDLEVPEWRIVLDVLTDWKVWAHCAMALIGLQYSPPIGTYSPSIIKSFGFGTLDSNLFVMPNSVVLIIATISLSWWSDRFNTRSIPITFAAVWLLVGLIVLDTLPSSYSHWYYYAFLVFVGGSPSWHPLNIAWLQSNQKTPRRRAIAVALYMMMTNLSGIPASYIFQAYDAPRYRNGFKALFAMTSVSVAIIIGMGIAYRYLNRRIERGQVPKDREEGWRYQL